MGNHKQTPQEGGSEGGTALQEARPKLKRPPLYKVLMLNDDYTPMDFVVHVLKVVFSMSTEKATEIMIHVHTRGVGVCGIYTRDIAETKADQVVRYAQEHRHPLRCVVEKA